MLDWRRSLLCLAPRFSPAAPSAASAVGYSRQTFNSRFAANKVDTANAKPDGKEWYLWSFFGDPVPSAGQLTFGKTLGSMTLDGGGGTLNGQIATAAKTGTGTWVGTTFANGGYFEVEIAFDPSLVITVNGWPSFWAMAIEHLADGDEQWPGQAANYDHFAELDMFEYSVAGAEGADSYGVNMHDRYGVYPAWTNDTLPYSGVVRDAPPATVWTNIHRIGCLWVPAVSGGAQGYVKFYFDGAQVGAAETWDYFNPNSAPPPGSSEFGILDHQRLALILGTGTSQPITVRSVKVWQR